MNVVVKNVALFCSGLKNLPEAKVKRFILIALTEEGRKKKRPAESLFNSFV